MYEQYRKKFALVGLHASWAMQLHSCDSTSAGEQAIIKKCYFIEHHSQVFVQEIRRVDLQTSSLLE